VTKSAKRRGRPFKKAAPGERAPLSLLVRAEVKRLVDKRAQDSGRTQSQEAEALIEKCLAYDEMMESMRTTLADMQNDSVEAALFRLGYTPVREIIEGRAWKVWCEPGHPRAERSGFVS